jgi:5-methylcytosine-specific restriction endonuclease McrA
MKTEKYRSMVTGKNSPVWKGGVNDPRWDRLKPEYKSWKISVFQRDAYSCQKCLATNTYIEAHHIFNWNDNPDKRYEIENGITFCKNCHSSFHKIYGKKHTNLTQLTEYINQT